MFLILFHLNQFLCLRIHWRFLTISKRSSKSVWSNVFWHVKVHVFWKIYSIYTMYWDETQTLKTFPSDKINVTKNAVCLWALTHHSFTFNLRFSYELKRKVRLSKVCVGFSIFNSVSFLLKFIFLFNKKHGLFDFKTSNFFSKLK